MSEGDPDDERDDERRHDPDAPDERDADPSDEPTPDEEPDGDGREDGDGTDDHPDEPTAEDPLDEPTAEDPPDEPTAEDPPDEPAVDDPGPHPGPDEASSHQPKAHSLDDEPPEADGPTGKEQKRAKVGGDAEDSDQSEDVTISGGAAAPTPEEPEPVGHTGAPDDQEMPLTKHIEEMIRRLLVVIVVMAIVSAVVFPFADRLINFLWYSFLPGQPTDCVQQVATANATNGSAINATNGTAVSSDAACPRLYHPLSLVLARLKVASLSGFIIALPVFVYETYLFMRPGLYPNERRYYLASVPTSLVLAAIGVLFAYLLVLPLIFTYFLGYSQPVAEVAFGLSETFGLILLMLGMFAAIFQIPLFLMLAIMMGVTTRRWLEDRRLYFWFGFAGIAFLFSPDPTGMAPFIVALTMIVLFEGTLLLLRWTGR